MASRLPVVRKDGQNVQIPAGDGVSLRGPLDQSALYAFPTGNPSSAGVLDWSAATSDSGSVSEPLTISSMVGAPTGARRVLRFGSGVVLVHTSGVLELVAGTDRTTQFGDGAEFINRGAGRWQCLWYQKSDGTALVSSAGGSGDFKKDGSVQMTGQLQEAPVVAVTAAPAMSLQNVASNYIQINGASTAVALATLGDAPSGVAVDVRFGNVSNGLTLKHSDGLGIALPGGADIVVAIGDAARFRSDGNNNWKCLSYQRRNGQALVSSGSGPANTDALPEGTTNLYFTNARAQSANTDKVLLSSVGAANGVAPLGSDSKIASAYLPSYVDDVIEVANYASLPATGESGKIYVTDTAYTDPSTGTVNSQFRWGGSAYTPIISSAGTTTNVPEGTNLYFTAARVLSTVLAGLSLVTGTAVVATDSILVAAGKLQKQITDLTAVVAGKEPTIAAGTASQYWNGAKSFVDFAASVRSAVLTAISFTTSTPVTAADSVLTAIGKLQAQLTAYGGVFRTETITTSTVGQISYTVPNGYTPGSIIVFLNGALQAPADYTATNGTTVVLTQGALTTDDIMSVLVIGAVRAQDDALLQYTVASLPAASASAFKLRWCTNMSGGAGVVVSNGTNWVRVADNTVVTV